MELKFETSQIPTESNTEKNAPEATGMLIDLINSIVFKKTEFLHCENEGQTFIYSSNNQVEGTYNPLLAAELAVFSGNILKFILGEPQPEYYLAENKKKGKYYRISNKLEDYEDWNRVVRINAQGEIFFQWPGSQELPILSVKIRQLTAILVACHFLGEVDWADDNFGFVKVGDEFIAVRLDPGCSFHSSVFANSYSDLPVKLKNLLVSFIGEEIEEGQEEPYNYLSGLIDYENRKIKNQASNILFGNRNELLATLDRISELTREDLESIAKKSFTKEHWSYAENYINKLLNRQEIYDEAGYLLSKSKKQKRDFVASAPITPLRDFIPPEESHIPEMQATQGSNLERKRKFSPSESTTEAYSTSSIQSVMKLNPYEHVDILKPTYKDEEEEETTGQNTSEKQYHQERSNRLSFFSNGEKIEPEEGNLPKKTISSSRMDM
ncbi:Uncharacterised protein [Legionella wadsworthii]|uniref:Uncharacterized protein n=1 Tax=Legionella wadsworthii TaxID=28088 RepID=A0A378LRD6_9GAMM|nr:hypothetical protein [Legionella wadsworthii]STY29476.1 Uncharacterised protein [Legionella wadsworthii]